MLSKSSARCKSEQWISWRRWESVANSQQSLQSPPTALCNFEWKSFHRVGTARRWHVRKPFTFIVWASLGRQLFTAHFRMWWRATLLNHRSRVRSPCPSLSPCFLQLNKGCPSTKLWNPLPLKLLTSCQTLLKVSFFIETLLFPSALAQSIFADHILQL